MDGEAHRAVSRDVDEGGGPSLERVDRVVGDGAAIDPQALDELGAPRRGEPYQLDSLALRQQERRGDRGLARGAGDHDRPARGQPLVAELIVDQERGEEERTQQHLYFLGVRPVEGVGIGPHIALVGRGQRRSVRRGVHEAVLVGVCGRHDEVRGRGQVPVQARAGLDTLGLALLDLGEAPHRDAAPAVLGREEVPVGHRLAEHRVGDVVRRQPETVDPQERLTGTELGRRSDSAMRHSRRSSRLTRKSVMAELTSPRGT